MAESNIQPILDFLLSNDAVRVYAVSGVFVVLIISGVMAVWSASSLRAFLAFVPDFKVHGNIKKKNTIQLKLNELEKLIKNRLKCTIIQIFSIFMYGVFIPGFLVYVMIMESGFFFSARALISDTDSAAPGAFELLFFVIDQALRGGLSDTFEVFELGISRIQNNPDNFLFSISLLIFRTLSGVAAAATSLVILSYFFGGAAFKKIRDDLISRRDLAQS